MNKINKYILIIVIIFLSVQITNAQYEDIEVQKAKIVYEIYKFLIWEDDFDVESINIAVLNCSPEMFEALDKNKPKKIISGVKITLEKIENPRDINLAHRHHVIYVGNENKNIGQAYIKQVNDKAQLFSIALFTDSWSSETSKKKVMFNIITKNNQALFEYNLRNVEKANLTLNPDFFKLGGFDLNSEDEKNKIEIEIIEKRKELEKQNKEVEKQKKEVEEQKEKIRVQDEELLEKGEEIKLQTKKLQTSEEAVSKQQNEIQKQKITLREQESRVVIKEKEIARKQKDIEVFKNKISEQQKEYQDQQKLLEEQKKHVAEEKAKVALINKDVENKKAELRKLNFTIQMQRWALGIFIILLFVIVVLLFFIYKNFRQKKKQNILLEEKNVEIEAQSEELSNANLELEKLSIVASETVNAVAILDNSGNFDWVNAGYTKLYGYTLQLLKNELGKNIKKTSTNPYIKELIKKSVVGKESVKFETFVQSRDGQKLWVQTTLTPIINNVGKVTKLVSIDSDITEIKEAEEQIKKQNKKIMAQSSELEFKNSELAKLSLVAEETDNAVIIADKTGEIEWVNPGFEKLHETTINNYKEQNGSNIVNYNLSPEILDLITSGLREQKSVTYSTKTKTGKGNELWLQTSLTPMYDSKGNLTKLFAIDADITKIKIAEQKIAKQNKNIRSSIIYASRIQTAVLPPLEYIKTVLPEHFIMFRPRDIVSGDYYWVTNIEQKILFTAADSTGHGVPGAFMSMLGVAFLNEITAKSSYEELRPDIILNKLRNKVKLYLRQTGKEGESKDGYDICFCMLDKEKNELHYAGAHNPLLLVRNGKMTIYQSDDMPIGIYYHEKASFTNHIIKPQKDDIIYLFSDGYPDQFGGKRRRKFMIKRFREMLTEISPKSLKEQKEILDTRFDKWKGKYQQLDDIVVMGVRL